MKRTLAIIGGVVFGLATWFALIDYSFHYTSEWPAPIRQIAGYLAFWLSHWTLVGWGFGIGLMILWYKLLMRVLVGKAPQSRAPTENAT